MPALFTKKCLIIAVATMMALVTTAYAVGAVKYYVTRSSSTPEFTSAPTDAQLNKSLGFVPNVPKEFTNGYKFESAVIGNSAALDENNKTVSEFKVLSADYIKDNKEVILFTQDFIQNDMDSTSHTIATFNGIELKYTSYTNITLDADDKLTEEDKLLEQSGNVVFGYTNLPDGTRITQEIQALSFINNGVHYQLLCFDNPITQDELVAMAKDLIK